MLPKFKTEMSQDCKKFSKLQSMTKTALFLKKCLFQKVFVRFFLGETHGAHNKQILLISGNLLVFLNLGEILRLPVKAWS